MDTKASYVSAINLLLQQFVLVLGPDVVYAKVARVSGLEVNGERTVVNIEGDPQSVFSELLNNFSELSDVVVKKTLASLVASQSAASQATTTQVMHQAHRADAVSAPSGQGIDPNVAQVLSQSLSQMNSLQM